MAKVSQASRDEHVVRVLKAFRVVIYMVLVLFFIACVAGVILFKFSNLSYYVILSGSMRPDIDIDDVVISQNLSETDAYDALEIGDVATYFDGKNYITHRVYDKRQMDDGEYVFLFKGDNNNVVDKNTVKANQIRGKYLYTLKDGADVFGFITNYYGIITIILILVMLFLIDNTIVYAINYKQNQMFGDSGNNAADNVS